jgi:hypothetical protein
MHGVAQPVAPTAAASAANPNSFTLIIASSSRPAGPPGPQRKRRHSHPTTFESQLFLLRKTRSEISGQRIHSFHRFHKLNCSFPDFLISKFRKSIWKTGKQERITQRSREVPTPLRACSQSHTSAFDVRGWMFGVRCSVRVFPPSLFILRLAEKWWAENRRQSIHRLRRFHRFPEGE